MNPQDPMIVRPNQPVGGPQPVAQPEQMFQPIVPPEPQTMQQPQPGPQPTPAFPAFSQTPPEPITKLPTPPQKKSMKKPLIVATVLILLLGGITAGAVLMSGSKPKQAATQQQTDQPQGPQPAQAIDVEQTNNSINQDVTGFDNTKDFPDTMLDDSALGL